MDPWANQRWVQVSRRSKHLQLTVLIQRQLHFMNVVQCIGMQTRGLRLWEQEIFREI
jgi:hypothetical protein